MYCKVNNGSIENRGIQSNQGVHVYGIWWIGVFVVFVANLYFFGNRSFLKLFQERLGLSLLSFSFFKFREAGIQYPLFYLLGHLSIFYSPFFFYIFA